MKTRRLLVALCLVAGFSINYVNAQAISEKKIDMPFDAFIDCAGEEVVGTFNLHLGVFFDKDDFSYRIYSHPMGGDLIGLDSGDTYHTTGITWEAVKTDPWHYTFVNRFHIVGPGVQFRLYWVQQVVVNANGEVTVEFEKSNIECN